MITHEFRIVNGHRHGEVIRLEDEPKNGDVINSGALPCIRKVSDDVDIRYSRPLFTDKFRIIGDIAYYIGQSMSEPWFDDSPG